MNLNLRHIFTTICTFLWRIVCLARNFTICIGMVGITFTTASVFAGHATTPGIPSSLFELEGDGTDNPAGGPEDWNKPPTGDPWTGIQADDDTKAFKGGSKDTRQFKTVPGGGGFTEWAAGANVTGKANILNSYAVVYPFTNKDGLPDIAVFFGADRQDSDGTVSMTFCLYQNDIFPLATGGLFSDIKVAGDICVFVEVLGNKGGGIVDDVVIRRWDGSTLVDVATAAVATCDPDGAGVGYYQDFCAISNVNNLNLPWRAGSLEPGVFIEGVVRLGAFDLGCVSTISITTSNSNAVTDTIEDFTFDGLEICSVSTEKFCDSTRKTSTQGYCVDADPTDGDAVDEDTLCDVDADCTDTDQVCSFANPQLTGSTVVTQFRVPVTASGPAGVFDVTLTDNWPDSTHPSASCDIVDIEITGTGTASISPPTTLTDNTPIQILDDLSGDAVVWIECISDADEGALEQNFVQVKAASADGGSFDVGPDEFTFANSCAPAPNPGLDITKVCTGDAEMLLDAGGNIKWNVPVNIKVKNTGNEKITNIAISDDKIPAVDLPAAFSLNAGAMMSLDKIYMASFPDDDPSDATPFTWNGCNVQFTDTAQIDGAIGEFSGTLSGGQLDMPDSATCFFCPTAGCPRTP